MPKPTLPNMVLTILLVVFRLLMLTMNLLWTSLLLKNQLPISKLNPITELTTNTSEDVSAIEAAIKAPPDWKPDQIFDRKLDNTANQSYVTIISEKTRGACYPSIH